MKLAKLALILLISLSFKLTAQNQSDYFNINNYKRDVALTFNAQNQSANILSDYGSVTFRSGSAINNYIFQGQEFDNDLDLYFYPSRIYSAKEKKFYQPDPKSQYFSPYLFIGADPVNMIDTDGNEGKPLVLFQEDFREATSRDASITDLMEDIPNAHYVPMSDFVNGEVGALPEWNGNVFLKGHSTNVKGSEIITEEMNKGSISKTKSMHASRYRSADSDGHEFMAMDSKMFGKKLRTLSEREGVEVKSIISGSCEGSIGAEKVGKGFTDKKLFGKSGKRSLRLGGLKKKKYALFGGKKHTAEEGIEGFDHSRFYVGDNPEGSFVSFAREAEDGKFHLEGFQSIKAKKGASPELPYADTSEIEGMYNGRIPTAHAKNMKLFDFTY